MFLVFELATNCSSLWDKLLGNGKLMRGKVEPDTSQCLEIIVGGIESIIPILTTQQTVLLLLVFGKELSLVCVTSFTTCKRL